MNPTIINRYLLLPIPKNPYSRIGPVSWQDYYRQIERTIDISRQLKRIGSDVVIAVISAFRPSGRPSEIDIYVQIIHKLAPDVIVRMYKETNDTVGQIERGFDLACKLGATPIFIATWMHYPRVRYLVRRRPAKYCGAFGLPHPAFFFIDLFCIIAQPIGDFLGISDLCRAVIIREREKGRIL